MKPVFQTLDGQGAGDCFAACLASLLEVSIAEVPDLVGDLPRYADDDNRLSMDWWRRFVGRVNTWLLPRDLVYFEVSTQPEVLPEQVWVALGGLGYWIACGELVGGGHHAVVMHGDLGVAHDPAGVSARQLRCIHSAGFLVPLNPAAPRG